MIDGIWPGHEDQQLLSQFISLHFDNELECYSDFLQWRETRMDDRSGAIATVSMYFKAPNKGCPQAPNDIPCVLNLTQSFSPHQHHDKSPKEGDDGWQVGGEEVE